MKNPDGSWLRGRQPVHFEAGGAAGGLTWDTSAASGRSVNFTWPVPTKTTSRPRSRSIEVPMRTSPRSDRSENVRREICLSLEEMGLGPESSHHERGPGQNEVDFCYSDPLSAADNFLTFKSVAKSIAAQNGLFASFMPKPLEGECGNGMHINLSVLKNGKNLFQAQPQHSEHAESFIQGILERTAEITAFLNPLPNSYRRLGSFEAPGFVSWSHQNRSQLIRIPAARTEKISAWSCALPIRPAILIWRLRC